LVRLPTMRLNIPGKAKPYLLAHRGNQVVCPENTLASFRRAFADGIDILETDVRLTADSAFVCIHDSTVDRTTNGTGEVARMTSRQLRSLKADCGKPGFEDARIPLLEEVLAIVPPDVVLGLELKIDDFLKPAIAARLLAELRRFNLVDRTILLSFSFERLLAMREAAPALPIGWITCTRPMPRPRAELQGPLWPLLVMNPLYPFLAHLLGQVVCPLDPEPDRRLWYYCLLGCDAVLTDNPAATRPGLERWRRLYALVHGRGARTG
jgi:glycerophosphoryl diester phosphodiesterase